MKVCGVCGTNTEAADLFCSNCGAGLVWPGRHPLARRPLWPALLAGLVAVAGLVILLVLLRVSASITVTHPTPGETWQQGSALTIRWDSTGVKGELTVELSRDGGLTWEVLASAVPDTGSQTWTVTGPATTSAVLRVSSGGKPAAVGTSGSFEISVPPVTHTVVALLPLTGVLSTFGENSKEAALLAARDVNAWLVQEGKAWRLDVEIEDDATHGPTALRKMQTWFGNGVKFFIGPQSSGACRECLAFANSSKILFISQSSTSPALSIANDWLFRFCTDDFIQGPGIARAAYDAGVRHLIFCWRGDTWGDGVYAAADGAAKKLGITMYGKVLRYDPGLEDFPNEAALLNGYVQDLLGKGVPKARIGIVIIAFEEIAPFMAAADKYPVLREIVWVGSDGTAMSEVLMKHPVASRFAVATKFINTLNAPGQSAHSRTDYVRGHVFQVLGRETDAYSYNTYDMVWSLARAIDEVGYDSEKVKAILPRVADQWTKLHGASGHVVLNAAGDRAFADYDLWLINHNIHWERVGTYRGGTDTIDWWRRVY